MRFPAGFITVISPRTGKCLAGLPCLSFVLQQLCGFYLFRRYKVATIGIFLQVEAVVDNDAGLQFADQSDQLNGAPVVFPFPEAIPFRKRKIGPQDIDLTVFCKQFRNLVL